MTGNVSMEVLAKQCGTSIQTLEQHYSHVVPKMFTKELSGVDIGTTKPKKKQQNRRIQQRSSVCLKSGKLNIITKLCVFI